MCITYGGVEWKCEHGNIVSLHLQMRFLFRLSMHRGSCDMAQSVCVCVYVWFWHYERGQTPNALIVLSNAYQHM